MKCTFRQRWLVKGGNISSECRLLLPSFVLSMECQYLLCFVSVTLNYLNFFSVKSSALHIRKHFYGDSGVATLFSNVVLNLANTSRKAEVMHDHRYRKHCLMKLWVYDVEKNAFHSNAQVIIITIETFIKYNILQNSVRIENFVAQTYPTPNMCSPTCT